MKIAAADWGPSSVCAGRLAWAGRMQRRRPIRSEPRHMENVSQRIEIVARGEACQFVRERSYVESSAGG